MNPMLEPEQNSTTMSKYVFPLLLSIVVHQSSTYTTFEKCQGTEKTHLGFIKEKAKMNNV